MRKPTKFGKYLLLDRIAVGGMAEVFVAKAFGVEGFERLLAIKKILPTMGEDPEFISMFVDEARIAVQLSHANIVQILELGKHDENLYIAMEYIAGRDLRQVLERFRKKGRPMPVQVACLVIAKVCEALDYAHRKQDARGSALGIVHRDVSPQNVLVSYDGDVKLIDFGIAKAESRLQKTQAGILKGKFSYMSPEQVRGQPIDHRSDVFAVGVVLWELLTGDKLFTGDSDFAILEKVRQGIVPRPRQLNAAIPEALETVVMKALKAEVAERYQWASELHDDLIRFCLQGDTVYGGRQLAEWLREEFSAEADREQERMRLWMTAGVDEMELTPPARAPAQIAAAERKRDQERRERKSPPTLHDRPAARPMPLSAITTAPELPSLKLPPGLSPVDGDTARIINSGEFRVPRDEDTLVAPPTPPGGTPRLDLQPVPLFSKPDHFALGALDQTPSAALSLQELPTMKMDEDVLMAAERALLERQAEAARPVNGAGGKPALGAATASPAAATVPESRSALPAVSLPAAAALASNVAETARRPFPLGLFDEPTRTLPAQSAKPEEKAAKERREQAKAVSKQVVTIPRIALGGFGVGLLGLLALWLSLRPEPSPPGTLVVDVRPSVAATVLIDGKPVGSAPVVVPQLSAGLHQLEVRAPGYKPFSRSVALKGEPRPVEVQVELASDAPAPLVSTDMVLGPQKQPAESSPAAPPKPAAAAARPRATDDRAAEEAAAVLQKRTEPRRPQAVARIAPKPEQPKQEPPRQEPPKPEAPKTATLLPEPEPVAPATPKEVPPPEPSNAPPRLRITSEPPGASVTVDGKAVGSTPVVVAGLDPWKYHAVAATLDGYAPSRRAAKLEASGTTLMHLPLRTQGLEASSKPAHAEPAAATAAPMGYLIAATSPVASVQIDGRETGRWTPVPPANPIALPAGDHTVVFVTANGHKIQEQITIEAGKTKSLIRKLR